MIAQSNVMQGINGTSGLAGYSYEGGLAHKYWQSILILNAGAPTP